MWLISICGVRGWKCETDDTDSCNCTGAIPSDLNPEKVYHVSIIPNQ